MGSAKTKHKHIHQFHLVKGIWRCALPNCVWFMHDTEYARGIMEGRATQCNNCSQQWIIDANFFFGAAGKTNHTPICEFCANPGLRENTPVTHGGTMPTMETVSPEVKARRVFEALWGQGEWDKLPSQEKEVRIKFEIEKQQTSH